MQPIPTPTVILLLGTATPLNIPLVLPLFIASVLGIGLAVVIGSILRIIGVVRSTMAFVTLILLLTVLPSSMYLASIGWQSVYTKAKQDIEAQVKIDFVTSNSITFDVNLSQPAIITAWYGDRLDHMGLIAFADDPATVSVKHRFVLKRLSSKTLYYIRLDANNQPLGEVIRVKTK